MWLRMSSQFITRQRETYFSAQQNLLVESIIFPTFLKNLQYRDIYVSSSQHIAGLKTWFSLGLKSIGWEWRDFRLSINFWRLEKQGHIYLTGQWFKNMCQDPHDARNVSSYIKIWKMTYRHIHIHIYICLFIYIAMSTQIKFKVKWMKCALLGYMIFNILEAMILKKDRSSFPSSVSRSSMLDAFDDRPNQKLPADEFVLYFLQDLRFSRTKA